MINDAHVHFFSPGFFAGLGTNRQTIADLGWDFPDSVEALSDRWVAELDKHGVSKAALIASLPGDADSVARAVALNAIGVSADDQSQIFGDNFARIFA